MALVSVAEVPNNRGASVDERGHRRYRRTWRVVFDNLNHGAAEAADATGAYLYAPYVTATEVDLGATVRSISPHETEDFATWMVDVDYSSEWDPVSTGQGPAGPGNTGGLTRGEENPVLRRAVLRWSSAKYTKAFEKAYDASNNLTVPVVNTAGEPFKALETERIHLVLTIEKNFSSFDPNIIGQYTSTVNHAVWLTVPAERAFMANIEANQVAENFSSYWHTTWSIFVKVRPEDTWDREVASTGFNRYVLNDEGDAYKRVPILIDGMRPTEPQFLTADGQLMDMTRANLAAPLPTPVYLTFKEYPRRDFSLLNIP
jgi:hypothetical protein